MFDFNLAPYIPAGVAFFMGLTVGWFFRNGITLWAFIALIIMLSVLEPFFIIIFDGPLLSLRVAFFLGVLVHTWRRIYNLFSR